MEKFIEALKSPKFAYTRARSWRADGYVKDNSDYTVYCYHKDETSPSGVSLAATCGDFDAAVKIMDELSRPFPLSPTEPR